MKANKRDLVVALDKQGKKVKLVPKLEAHLGKGILHKAIAVLIFNEKGEVLLQRRSKNKMLWPLYWDLSCASHPFWEEDYISSSKRRLKEELNIKVEPILLGDFFYQAFYKNVGIEKEICGFLVGIYNRQVKNFNKEEVAEIKWVDFLDLLLDIRKDPRKYTPWLIEGVEQFLTPLRNFYFSLIFKYHDKILEKYLKDLLVSNIEPEFREISLWPILTGGKRIRPVLAHYVYKLIKKGRDPEELFWYQAGLEIAHNFTLIVDDIIDNSKLRRSKPTLWWKYGKTMALVESLNYAASILEGVSKVKKAKEVGSLIAEALKRITDGERLDVLFERGGRGKDNYVGKHRFKEVTLNGYFKMIEYKTASLFRVSAKGAGIIAGASNKKLKAISEFGKNFGFVFQITDDILDIFGKESKFGKKIGKDIEEHKGGNLVILLALKDLPKSKANRLNRILQKNKLKKEDIETAVKLISTTKAKDKAFRLAQEKADLAKKALNCFPDSKEKLFLRELTDFLLLREA